jgi:hypothetical protein
LSGSGLAPFTRTMNELFDTISKAVDARADKTIHFEQFDEVIDEAFRAEIITLHVRPSTFKKLTRVFARKVFTPVVNGKRAGSDSLGMTRPVFERAREGFFGWLDMQRMWAEVKSQAIAREPRLYGKGIPYATASALWKTVPTQYKRDAEDIQKLLDRKPPLVISDPGTVIFDRDAGSIYGMTQWGFDSLNWKAHFARVVGQGWSADPEANRYRGVTKDEFHTFYNDAVELAVDLTLVEPNDKTIWDTTFDESNMFMLGGDGDGYFSFFEGTDFIADAMASTKMVDRMYGDLRYGEGGTKDRPATKICDDVGSDAFLRPTYAIECYRMRSLAKFTQYYDYMPTWTALAKQLGPRINELQTALEQCAFKNGPATPTVSLGDINKVSMVIQYLESLYVRFDWDQSGTIDVEEAKAAFPLFKELLKKAPPAQGMGDDDLLAVFLYVLRYKHAPTTLADKLDFQLFWRKMPSRWEKIHADRLAITQILGQLKELTRTATP